MTTESKPNGKGFEWFPDPDATIDLHAKVHGDIQTLRVKRCLTVQERDEIEELWMTAKVPRQKIRESIVRVVKGWTLTYPGTDKPVPVTLDSLNAMHAHGLDAIWAVIDPHLADLTNLQAGPTLPQVRAVHELLARAFPAVADLQLTSRNLEEAWRAQGKAAVAADPPSATVSGSG